MSKQAKELEKMGFALNECNNNFEFYDDGSGISLAFNIESQIGAGCCNRELMIIKSYEHLCEVYDYIFG